MQRNAKAARTISVRTALYIWGSVLCSANRDEVRIAEVAEVVGDLRGRVADDLHGIRANRELAVCLIGIRQALQLVRRAVVNELDSDVGIRHLQIRQLQYADRSAGEVIALAITSSTSFCTK